MLHIHVHVHVYVHVYIIFKSSYLLSYLHVSVDKQEEKNQGILLSWISFCFLFIEYSIETLQLKPFFAE